MARHILTIIYSLTFSILPSLADYGNGGETVTPTSTEHSTPTSTAYTLDITATPTGDPWVVSYTGYSSLSTMAPTPPDASASGARFHPDGASPDFYCEYPTLSNYQPCNAVDSRDCWLRKTSGDGPDEINIHTDYENPARVPDGVTREYWLELDGDVTLTADGFQKTTGKVFNTSFPGPKIEACWGDQVVIHVKNNYDKNGTTVHWHGIRQLNTNQMDGVNGVTQCPISKGDSFTYKWRALQYGHTWYHSHYALQYGDGAVGPLVIYGPNSADWDVDLGPVLIQDYVHDTAFVAYQGEKTQTNIARTNSIVVNGQGHDPATGTGSYFNPKLTPGKKHRIQLVNSAVGTSFIFSIDNHPFDVIATDLVAIEPYNTTSLSIGIGQRYTIIVEASQAVSSYWIRTHPATRCNAFVESLGSCNGTGSGAQGVFDDNCVLFDVRTAIATYDGAPDPTTTALPVDDPFTYGVACLDEPYANIHPVVQWVIDNRPANNITRDRFTLGRQAAGLAAAAYEPGGYQHWLFTPDPFWIDFGSPTVLNTSFPGPWERRLHVVDQPYDTGFIFMIFEAAPTSPAPDSLTIIPSKYRTVHPQPPDKFFEPAIDANKPVSHPIHWHGHDVVILAQNQSQFKPDESFAFFNFDNPPRRDVVLLPEQGYIAIAMRADNPGVWLIHCHIAWHSSSGLAMQNLENQGNIVNTLGGPSALDETQRVCDNWNHYNSKNPIVQDESGV